MSDLPLSTGELVQMRHTIDELTLAGTAVIHTATQTSDGQGGSVHTYAASGTVDCHLSPENQRSLDAERLIGGRLAEITPFILTVPSGTSIDEDDRVVVSSVTYEVSEVLDNRTWQLAKRVRLVEVD